MVARLNAITGQAQHIRHAHGSPTQNITLHSDSIFVSAGNLHHRCIANPGEQGTHRQA